MFVENDDPISVLNSDRYNIEVFSSKIEFRSQVKLARYVWFFVYSNTLKGEEWYVPEGKMFSSGESLSTLVIEAVLCVA